MDNSRRIARRLHRIARREQCRWGHAVERKPDRYGGWGLFARIDIPPNTLCIRYVGEVLTKGEFDDRYRHKDPIYCLRIHRDHIIDAAQLRQYACAHMLNHSSDPNCQFQGRFGVNTRAIAKGDELTVNYGRSFFACPREFAWD